MKATQSAPARPPWLPTALRVVVHALAGAVVALPLTVEEGVIAAALGGALGALLARFGAASRWRLGPMLLGACVALGVVFALGRLVVGLDVFAQWLGPAGALRVGECVVFGLGALVVSGALRVAATRLPALAMLEVAVVALAFAQLVVAHRHGAINRPFEIADPILATGGDPTVAMLAIGVLAAGAIVLLLLAERSPLRSVLHLGAVAAVLALILFGAGSIGLPPPPPSGGGLGLRDDDTRNDPGRTGGNGNGGRTPQELEFRDDYSSAARRVPVAVVLMHDDYSSPNGLYYLRQTAFSHYNGRRMVASLDASIDRDLATHFPTEPFDVAEPPRPGFDRTVLETTVALLADHARPFAIESPISFSPAPNANPQRFRRTYRARSAVIRSPDEMMIGRTAGDASWTAEQRAEYLEGPADPRYAQLANELVARLPEGLRDDPMVRAMAIRQWLGHEGKYSLRSRHAAAEDPAADFLFGDKTGYCVHFAHAAVYLLRAAGVPARVATGYLVDESARQGGSTILVTGEMSHAWPEIRIEGAGWVVADVYPETSLDPPPEPPDPDLQRLLGELLRGEEPVLQTGRPPPIQLAHLQRLVSRSLRAVVPWVLACLLALFYGAKLWRRIAPRVLPARTRPRVALRAGLDALAEVGVVRAWGESREAFARRVQQTVPTLPALTRENVAAAFGGRVEGGRAGALLGDVRREVAKAFPFWRRALGWAVPWSFLRVR